MADHDAAETQAAVSMTGLGPITNEPTLVEIVVGHSSASLGQFHFVAASLAAASTPSIREIASRFIGAPWRP
jgi:hypothetical protein